MTDCCYGHFKGCWHAVRYYLLNGSKVKKSADVRIFLYFYSRNKLSELLKMAMHPIAINLPGQQIWPFRVAVSGRVLDLIVVFQTGDGTVGK